MLTLVLRAKSGSWTVNSNRSQTTFKQKKNGCKTLARDLRTLVDELLISLRQRR